MFTIISKLIFHQKNRGMLFNVWWLCSERFLQLVIGLFTFSWMVRYLQPGGMGVLAYASSLVALFGAISALGLDRVVIKRIVSNSDNVNETIGTAFILKVIGGLLAFLMSIMAVKLFGQADSFWIVVIIASGYLFQGFGVIEYWFRSEIKSKYPVIIRMTVFIVINALRILLILFKAPLAAFAGLGVVNIILIIAGLLAIYRFKGQNISRWKFNKKLAGGLLRESWPLMVSGLAVTVLTQIDRVVIDHFFDKQAVGLFSVAAKLSEVWYIIPLAVVDTVFPVIINAKKESQKLYIEKTQLLYVSLIWLSVIMAMVIMVSSGWVVRFLYGSEYTASAGVLSIHIWTLVSLSFGLVSGHYFIVEKMMKMWLFRDLIGAFASIILNIVLVARYNIIGAAWAVLISQVILILATVISVKFRREIKPFSIIFNIPKIKELLKSSVG